jgi:hypothetical protein
MNKKIYSFAMMALLAFGSATPLVAQEAEDVAVEETAAEPEKFKGLQFDVPALDPKHKAVCDDYMNNMFVDPEKANKSLQRLLRSIQRKPEALVAVGHYFVTNSTNEITYYGPAKMCSDKVYETPAATEEYVLMFCMETAMLGRDYGNAGRFCDVLLSQNESNLEALKLKARIYKLLNPIVAIEALELIKKHEPSYYQADKDLADIHYEYAEKSEGAQLVKDLKTACQNYKNYFNAVPKTKEDIEYRAALRYSYSLFTAQMMMPESNPDKATFLKECQDLTKMVLDIKLAPDANREKPFKAYQFFCDVDAGNVDAAMMSSAYVTNQEYHDSLYTYLDYLYAAKYEESMENKLGAVEYYKKGLALDSTKAPGFKAVADLYRQLGQAALGIEYYEKYLSLIGKEKSLGDDLGLANLYLAASNKCDSTQVELRDQYKTAADNIYQRISDEMTAPENEGKYDASLFYLPWYYRAQLWITNPAAAEEKPKMYYEKALELIGDNAKLNRQKEICAQYLMLYYFKTNNDEECMKYLETVIIVNPNNRVANQIMEVLM